MEKNMKWEFEKYTKISTRQDSSSDKFFNEANESDSLIREFIQNSLDAVNNTSKPVKVIINTKKIKQKYLRNLFDDLKVHLKACDILIDNYNENCVILEDFNTKGLEGSYKERFFHADNITDKTEGGGSHGIGKAVFSSASQLKAFLGYSLFKNNGSVFQGRAVLKTRKINLDEFRPYGNLEIDKEYHSFISELFSRQKETGLSVVIPGCDISIEDMEQSCLRQFYMPIINKKLEIEVGDKKITSNTLLDYIDRSSIDIKNKINLAMEWKTAPIEHIKNYKIKELDWKNMKLPKLEKDNLQNQTLFIKCDIKLSVKDGSVEKGSAILLIKKMEEDIAEQEIDCWRDNLLITSALGHNQKEREYSAIMLIENNPLSYLLRGLEDPGHTKWSTARIDNKLKEKYKNIPKLVKFIKKLPLGLIRQIKNPPLSRDLNFFADYFPKISPSESISSMEDSDSENRGANKKGLSILPVFEDFIYKSHKNSDGFTLKLKNKEQYPSNITVQTAYGTNKGNAFKNYDDRDFKFEKDIKIEVNEGSLIFCKEKNRVQCAIKNKDFAISFTGFDPNRELKIDVIS